MGAMQRSPKAKGGDIKSENGRQPLPSDYQGALSSAGINERTARRWQELANVPKEKFEDALRDKEKKPTTTGVLETLRPLHYLKIGSRAVPLDPYYRR